MWCVVVLVVAGGGGVLCVCEVGSCRPRRMPFGKRGERRGAGQWVSLCTGLCMLSEGLLDEGAGIEQRNVVSGGEWAVGSCGSFVVCIWSGQLLGERDGIEQHNVVSACRGGGYVCGLLCSSEVGSCRLTGPTLLRIVVSEGGGARGLCVHLCVWEWPGGPACSYLCVSRVGGCKMREPASSSTTW